jgi:DNA modification methylase
MLNPEREIRFKRDTVMRQDLFTPESFGHPAKMDSQLEIWLIEKFTKPGETILDPMFGSGTAMLACTLGRNVVGVELEEKFVKMASDNWEKVRQRPQLGYEMGTCRIIHGDARNLSGLMADTVITSPPYAVGGQGVGTELHPERMAGTETGLGRGYSVNPLNIGNLPYKPDHIIASPPFGGSEQVDNRQIQNDTILSRKGYGNAHRETYGHIDSVITSPPYEGVANASKNTGSNLSEAERIALNGERKGNDEEGMRYSQSPTNIGNLKADNYLSAMATVYGECFKVLKSGGNLVLVTKNFIRARQEVRLDLDTIKLCEQAGFKFIDRWYRRLPAQSFWRILYRRRFPDAPELTHEDILVFKKAGK